MSASDIIRRTGAVTLEERCRLLQQRGLVVWFTGLSGAGKSTLSEALERQLHNSNRASYRLDGDDIRCGLNADLGFSREHRRENIRRMAEVAALFKDAGLIVLVAVISPHRELREFAREKAGAGNFIEVYVKADLKTCEERDVKGLYRLARRGEIRNMTGISSPYEPPENPDITIDTTAMTVEEAVARLFAFVVKRGKEPGRGSGTGQRL